MEPKGLDDILERARELGPFADDRAAAGTIRVVLGILSRRLMPEERRALALSLEGEAAQILRQAEPAAQNKAPLLEEVVAAEGIGPGLAVEHLQVVARALGEVLEPAPRALLARALPELSGLLQPEDDEQAVPLASERLPGTSRDLAEGREGGRHPLASSDPARLAHRNSVARSDDPHGDSKLSSARGLTQEREWDTLATGRPGSKRPLSSGH